MIEASTDIFSIVSKKNYEDLELFRIDEGISKKLFNKLYRSGNILVNFEKRAKYKNINKDDVVTLLMEEKEIIDVKLYN